MTGNPKVIALLQSALASELRAIAQYRQDAAVLENANLDALAKYFSDFAGQEDEHFRELLARITFLGGRPAVDLSPATTYRDSIEEILDGNLALELQARQDYQTAADEAAASWDAVSRDLFADTAGDEEKHINWLEGELALFRELGAAAYTAAWKARV